MATSIFDPWGVWRDPAALRAKAQTPLFASWTARFVQEARERTGTAPVLAGEPSALARQAQDCALAFLLTEEAALADWAQTALAACAGYPGTWIHPGHDAMYPQDSADLMTADGAKAAVSALSFLWPRWSEAEREQLIRAFAERVGRPIYEGATAGCWWGTALNSNWTAVLNSGLGFAALALQQADAPAAQPWLDYAHARLVEMLDLAAEEGAGVEGTGYWLYCFGSIQDYVEALRNVGGEDLYAHPFWSVCSRFLPYLALPNRSGWVNYADTGYSGLGGSAFFHGVAARKRDGLAQDFAQRLVAAGDVGWKDLLYYDPSVAAEPWETQPPCRVFGSIHLASWRSDWSRDGTLFFFKGGSNAWSHTHLDLNSFCLYSRGERLAVDPGPAPYSLAYWHSIEPVVHTNWHNCIVVDGAHQRVPAQYAMSYDLEEAGDCYSRFEDLLAAPGFEMVRGDATTAYGDSLDRAWREVVYLKPEVFVIYDDLHAHPVRTQRNYEWLLHSECPLEEVAGGLEARGERGKLLIQPVLPADWEHKFVEGKKLPKTETPLYCLSLRPYWHHKWNVNPARSPYPHWDSRGDAKPLFDNHCRFLVVLSALSPEESPRYELTPLGEGTWQGVKLTNDEETAFVLFNPEGEVISLPELETDAEKLVLRQSATGREWGVVRGTRLQWRGETLLAADFRHRQSAVGLR